MSRATMAENRKPAPDSGETKPAEATPHNPGLSPKPGDPAGEAEPAEGAPYDKKGDPAQQPS